MKTKIISVVVLLLLVSLVGLIVYKKKHTPIVSSDEGLILYYSSTCPHCKNVDKYLEENDSQNSLGIAQKEVSIDEANANDFFNKAKKCNISEEEAGVPMLWDGEKCTVGDQPIISYVKEKLDEKQN